MESKAIFFFARRVIWMQLSDRVARGGEFINLLFTQYWYLHFQEVILVLLEQRATERTSSTMHRGFLDIQLLQTL